MIKDLNRPTIKKLVTPAKNMAPTTSGNGKKWSCCFLYICRCVHHCQISQ